MNLKVTPLELMEQENEDFGVLLSPQALDGLAIMKKCYSQF